MTHSETFPVTENTRLRRLPRRGSYDHAAVHAILDEALVAHVGFIGSAGQPVVLPTAFARRGDVVILHGSVVGRLMKTLAEGVPLCLTVTLLDGLVLAKSAFHHSMNYRSVTVFGHARLVTGANEKEAALRALTERLTPGRWDALRPVTAKEVAATTVLELPLLEAVAKTRSGPPVDDAEDLDWPVFAGVVPLSMVAGDAIPA
ncbi:pyridoxamine 5'-phosphate oxidase family protein [Zavarzinia compransoris]|uniref:pyridoxamine 5'-phosphate oxidase family protein n=1 Tax=Zavarzinia marina TaxID=2911065 RepID=UPI001F3A4349|nr:pyridoxamine 5'-phosphate oxidase family protein [Zavarzinia marina]MCF4166636.1 pyridoxamine 5'-phosphate oxidase family protein [Zavarzinia marina]